MESESFGRKSFQAGFLLANGDKGCGPHRQNLQSLPIRSKASTKAWRAIAAYYAYLAVATLGNGYCWPLPTAQGNFKFAVVVVEYFTKWIEARPLATITSTTIRKFF
jgi:hypothetical protein